MKRNETETNTIIVVLFYANVSTWRNPHYWNFQVQFPPTNIRADISKWLAVYYQLEERNEITIPIDFNSIYPDINARLL